MGSQQFSYKEMQELDDIVAGVIAGMGGKAEKEEAAITRELKRLIASKKKADIQKRKGWKGIKVDEEGNVEVTNMDKAMNDMDFFIKNFLRLRGRRR